MNVGRIKWIIIQTGAVDAAAQGKREALVLLCTRALPKRMKITRHDKSLGLRKSTKVLKVIKIFCKATEPKERNLKIQIEKVSMLDSSMPSARNTSVPSPIPLLDVDPEAFISLTRSRTIAIERKRTQRT
ncbi:hypothetical protein BWQ96_01138 [Gracilariopsis chorda]|uniref:Uncharacterized protein n=1 Tax=Gracilariopsis chorda TaxID=448386 RepID=A0A2V3J6J6_9FLOR|nr:hypothetical protein BWQ96_01138 [Gracilariopsis chorda]|eukprot:PXF49000.1 hypothetical protein BWQ96_01138 [Gracilariopsis chorda]